MGVISCDVTVRTNDQRFELFTLLVFDQNFNGVQVAWIITNRGQACDIAIWMEAQCQSGIHYHSL